MLKKILILMWLCCFSFTVFADGGTVQDNYIYAIKLLNNNEYKLAINEFKNVLKKTDRASWVSSTLFMLGKAYYLSGDKENSKKYLKRVLDNYPNSKFVIFIKQMINDMNQTKFMGKKNEESQSSFNTETTKSNETAKKEVIENLNNISSPEKKETVIVDYSDNSITNETGQKNELTNTEVNKLQEVEKLIKQGNDYFSNQNFEKALVVYKKASEIDPKNTISKFNLGIVYIKMNDFQKANELFEEVYKTYPNDIETLQYIAYTYQKINKPYPALYYWKRLKNLAENKDKKSYELAVKNIKIIQGMKELK